jgi:hypothetical protein
MKYVMLAAAAVLAVRSVDTALAQSGPSSFDAIRTVSSSTWSDIADQTAVQPGTSVASLSALLTEWDRAGFLPPSKPAQHRVYGRNGYVTNGPGYNAMVSLIRSAENDVREGREREAAMDIARARTLLAATNPAPG